MTALPAVHALTGPGLPGGDLRTVGSVPRVRRRAHSDRLAIQAQAAPVEEGERPPLAHLEPSPGDLPEPGRWAGLMAQSLVEVLVGARPVAQLQRWLAEEIWTAVADRAQGSAAAGRKPRARTLRVRVCPVGADACECAAVVHDGERVRAVAMRLQAYRGRWRLTALQIG